MTDKHIIMEITMQPTKTRSYDVFDTKKDGEWTTQKSSYKNREKGRMEYNPSPAISNSNRYAVFNDAEKVFHKKEQKFSRETPNVQSESSSASSSASSNSSRYNIFDTKKEEPKHEKKTFNKTRNVDIFDKMKNKMDEEREEKREYYSHIKFRSNKPEVSEFEVYSRTKYNKPADIDNIEAFPSLGNINPAPPAPLIKSSEEGETEKPVSKPVSKPVWGKVVDKFKENPEVNKS